jgi:hypothetical protein
MILIKVYKRLLLFLFGLFLIHPVVADITPVGTQTSAYAGNSQSITIARPAGVFVGDVMILNVIRYRNNNTTAVRCDGWTEINQSQLNTSNTGYRGAVFYKIITDSEPVSYQVFATTPGANSRIYGAIQAFRGVDLNDPIDVVGTFVSPSSTTNTIILPVINTEFDNSLVMQVSMNFSSSGSLTRSYTSWTTTSPGVLDELYDIENSPSTYVRLGLASAVKATAGSTGQGSILISGNSIKGGLMLALRPESPKYFRSRISGNYTSASTWEYSFDASNWVQSNRIPASYDINVEIQNGHIVDLSTSITAPQLQIDGTLNINGASVTFMTPYAFISGVVKVQNTANFTGTEIFFNDGSTYEHSRNGGTIPIASWALSSTCLINGITTTLPTANTFDQTFGNFTWDSSVQTGNLDLNGNLKTVNGNMLVSGTGSGSLNLVFSGTTPYVTNIAGNYTQTAGTVRLIRSGSSNIVNTTINVGGNLTLNGGTLDLFANTAQVGSATFNVAGNVSISNGTLTETGVGTANFNFTGTTPTRTFTKTGGTISNTINFNIISGASVNFGTSVLDGSNGIFNLSQGATIITANLNTTGALTMQPGANGTIQVTGTRTYNSSANYVLNGSGVQHTGNGLTGAANLTLNNQGTVLTNPVTVAGVLNLQSGIVTTSSANLLTLNNPGTNAIVNASSSNFITGPLRRYLTASLGGNSNWHFPVGSSSGYYPFELNNPTTGTGEIIVTIELKTGSTSGIMGANVGEMSNTEFWEMSSSGNLTNTRVNATRPVPPGNFNSIAGSTTQTGEYFSLNGSLSDNSINNSDFIGSNRFFVFAKKITPTPVVTVSTSSISSFTYPEGNGPSSDVSFTVSGSWLVSNITLQAPANFELSATGGSSFVPVSVLNVPAFGGTVNNVPVYVRMKAGLSQGPVSAANLIVSSNGAANQLASLSGTVTVRPVVSFSPSTLSGLTYKFAQGPSAQQSFVVTGSNLAGNVTLTPPDKYQFTLTSGSGFVSTPISVSPSGGSLNMTVYVRLINDLGVGAYNEEITATSIYAENKSISLQGAVTLSPTISLSQTLLSTFIYTSGSGPSGEQSFTVYGQELTGNVTVTAPTNFQVSTTSGSGFANSVTLTQSGGIIQQLVYVRMNAGLGTANYGPVNILLSSAGAVTKAVAVRGSVVGAGSPTILVSSVTLSGFGYLVNNGPSGTQTLTVSGASLGADITITPPPNYEISSSPNSGFTGSEIVLNRISQRVNPTNIFIRLKAGLAPAAYNQTLSIVSGAVSSPVILQGKVFASPLIAASGGGEYCTGSAINLVSTGEDIMNLYWVGPNNYYSIQQSPSIPNSTPALSGTYTVTGNVVVGGNLVINGDFELGDVGFGSSYGTPPFPYGSSALVPEGLYAVVDLPSQVHNNFSSSAIDHTPASGTKQMVVNGNITPGAVVWTQSVPVIQNADYEFNYWVQTVVNNNDPSPSKLQLYVNGVAAGPVYTANPTTGVWTQFIYNTNAGSNIVLNLELINQNIVAGGNDFALDDIVFQQILPASASTNVNVNNSLTVSVNLTYSPTVIYQNTPVQFTANAVNAGTNPTYVWKVNGVAVPGVNSSAFIYTPNDGETVTVEVTSSYPCATGNPAIDSEVLTVLVLDNYWMGFVSTDWGDEDNWTAGFVPVTGDNVEYATVANFGSIAQRDLVLDINRTIGSLVNQTEKSLIIPAAKKLTVNNIITTDGNVNRIIVKADSLVSNGSLIFHNPQNLPVSASVEMYSKATFDLSQQPNNRYNWQFFGIPLRSMPVLPYLYGAFVRRKVEWGTAINNHWLPLNNDSVMQSFVGYEICQKDPKLYLFQGQLANNDFSSGVLPVTTGALHPGQHLFANPFTAAIDIKQIEFGSSMDNAIYLYNTGSFNAWQGASSSPGTAPGTYVVVPKNLAGQPGIARQVPSMSTMLVKVLTPGSNAFVNLNYSAVTMANTEMQRVKAEFQEEVDKSEDYLVSLQVDIEGIQSADKLWLFSSAKFSKAFDNGYDGTKVLTGGQRVQIFVPEQDDIYQVYAVDNLDNANISIIPGEETNLRMVFRHQNTDLKYSKLFLHDLITNRIVDISEEGSVYSFKTKSGYQPVSRFRILTNSIANEVEDERINLQKTAGVLYVHNLHDAAGRLYLYDAAGKSFGNLELNALTMTPLRVGSPGVYILKVVYPDQTTTRKLIMD